MPPLMPPPHKPQPQRYKNQHRILVEMKIVKIEDKPFHDIMYRSSGRGGEVRSLTLPFYRVQVDALPKGYSAIVAVSDLQGREADIKSNRLVGEAVAEELLLLMELGEIPEVNLVLLAGDLYDYPDSKKLGGTGDVTAVWNAFSEITENVVGVHGNHDTVQEEILAANVRVLDGEIQAINGLNIGGVSGIIGRSGRNQRKSSTEFNKALRKAVNNKTEITLLHQGPDDPLNSQIGEPLVRDYLESQGSSLVLFGHCHWEIPYIDIGKHQVLNVDNRLYVFTDS
ncbi:metallophosphoesterase [Microbulbifer sp. SSSA002]|uniref:metallophosphoesterase family protein n=1 Tax=unclassified Microbulbifer TaxID=2619833 RepID=UPI004039CD61